jgi:phosphopentomutase
MKKFERIITIVLDSVGVGAAHDAAEFGDLNTDTLGHIAERTPNFKIEQLRQLGIVNLHPLKGLEPVREPKAYYTKLTEMSLGKDTMTGHWELMGLYIDTPFQTFTETGFPTDLIEALEAKTGYKVIGNKSASGTEIIDELGEEHMATKAMIVYTSADSVLQIAAHEDVFGLDELYRVCEIARKLTMEDKWKVGRVIARPFVGDKRGNFKRTSNRHDYALKPFGKTVLDHLQAIKVPVTSIGKIHDIFDGEGINTSIKTKSNQDGMEKTIEFVKSDAKGFCFVNLVDFDALWGHRRNVEGYAKELELFDSQLEELLDVLKEGDLLILTADHGNDPTHIGTDHTREVVPVLFYSKRFKGSGLLNGSDTFASIGATIADNFEAKAPEYGRSYLEYLN